MSPEQSTQPLAPVALIVNQACVFTLDKIFALVPLRTGLAGIRIRGQITGMETLDDVDDPWSYARPDWVEKYKTVSFEDLEALRAIDKHNFKLTSDEVVSAQLRSRRTWWTGGLPNSGTIKLKLRGGKSRKLILIGKQNPQAAIEFFERAGIHVILR